MPAQRGPDGRTAPLSRSANREAQAQFERGMYLRAQYSTGREAADILHQALEAFRSAARVDRAFAPARAEEAETLVEIAFAGTQAFRSALMAARESAESAAALDRTSATAHRVQAMTDLFLDWRFDAARRRLALAQRLAPEHSRTAIAWATYHAARGQHDQAIEAARRAVALDPASYFVQADLAFFYLAGGRNEEAAASSREVLLVAPHFVPALAYALLANERLGHWDEAAAAARRLMSISAAGGAPATLERLDPRDTVRAWRRWDLARVRARAEQQPDEWSLDLGLRLALAGERTAALDHLERAYASRRPLLVFVRSFPELLSLRGDPRFERLAEKIARGALPAG
jgi:tetratricopeptide (TPR) repeat protein